MNFLTYIFNYIYPKALILILYEYWKKKIFFIFKFSAGIVFSFFLFFLSIYYWFCFNSYFLGFSWVVDVSFISFLNIKFILGIDGISLVFIILTTFLIPFCVFPSLDSIFFGKKLYIIFILFIEIFLIISFCVLDLFLFFIFFESILIPMYLIINIYGSRSRKIKASSSFFMYTAVLSFPLLISILSIYTELGSTNFLDFFFYEFSLSKQLFLWFCLFITLGTKVPIYPFHIWLPEAHVEAPTAGSIILAGLLLKLGGYGFMRFLIPIFPQANYFYWPLICTFSLISITYSAFCAVVQIDLKKIIAYSSIAHMNLSVLGLFSLNFFGLQGAIILMLGHGFVSSILFFLVGVLYTRFRTRYINYFGDLITIMPFFSFFFFFFLFQI